MSPTKIFDILSKAAHIAEPVGRSRIVAAIVFKGEIISFGSATKKSHPFQNRFKRNDFSIYLHAEVDAIRRAHRQVDLSRCILYVCRVKKFKGNRINPFIEGWGMARPCEGCQKAIDHFKIPIVRYTVDSNKDLKWAEEKFN